MKQRYTSLFWFSFLLFMFVNMVLFAQTDSLKKQEEEIEDYSSYGDDTSVKRYCTQKVQFLAPTKLISLGYEVQLPQELTTTMPQVPAQNITSSHGLRLGVNTPIISRSNLIVNLGASYYESRMTFENPQNVTNPFFKSLEQNGLRTAGAMLTIFKPLNEKNFIIAAVNADMNGNFGWSNIPSFNKVRYSALSVYGWKKSDKLMWGLGVARTYRLGEVNYIPVLLLNKTFNDKWGVEALLPARGHIRRSFSAKSLAMFGYELEGNSYLINTTNDSPLARNLHESELRRSELKIRFMYEKSLYNFIWISLQAGLRVNMNFNISDEESSPRKQYIMENRLTNPLYFGFSINLVSP
jgi:hypothetical protein